MVPIDGYENYYSVTECGKVYSHRRKKYLSTGSASGYKTVCLCVKGNTKGFLVHRLVAIAFIPNPENKPQVNHKDGNKLNNEVSNLEWCTAFENVAHAISNGLCKPNQATYFKSGFDPRRNAKNKLSDKDVFSMRERFKNGETFRSISKDFPVDESQVRRCCKRQTYKHL